MSKKTETPEEPTIDAPAVREYVKTAREALDRGLEKQEAENPDNLIDVFVPQWNSWVQLRKLPFTEIKRGMMDNERDPLGAERKLLRVSFVQPPFSAGEVDEILNDPAHTRAAMTLIEAVNRINGLNGMQQAITNATFQADN